MSTETLSHLSLNGCQNDLWRFIGPCDTGVTCFVLLTVNRLWLWQINLLLNSSHFVEWSEIFLENNDHLSSVAQWLMNFNAPKCVKENLCQWEVLSHSQVQLVVLLLSEFTRPYSIWSIIYFTNIYVVHYKIK